MVQSSRGGRQSPGLRAGEEQIWRSYVISSINIGGSGWINNLDVDDGERAGGIQIG